jgi:hypothetical protein
MALLPAVEGPFQCSKNQYFPVINDLDYRKPKKLLSPCVVGAPKTWDVD